MRLFELARAQYGSYWRKHIKLMWMEHMDAQPYAKEDYRKLKSFFATTEFKLLGVGMFRCAFQWNNGLVIKVNLSGSRGNEDEVLQYKKVTDCDPLSRYFACPILKKLRIDGSLVLVVPKVDVFADSGKSPNIRQLHMLNVANNLFDDLHDGNIGDFCGGLVAIDMNFGGPSNVKNTDQIKRFAKSNPKFWCKYVTAYENTVSKLTKTCNLAI